MIVYSWNPRHHNHKTCPLVTRTVSIVKRRRGVPPLKRPLYSRATTVLYNP